ncbi:hypothetical protein [Kitasatospora sp. P5_F3]
MVALAAVVAVLSGCQQERPPAAATAAVPVPAASASERELLDWAEQARTADCMTKAGFRYYVEWARDAVVASEHRSDFGSADTDWAAKYGYGILRRPPRPVLSSDPAQTNAAYVGGLQRERADAYTAALNGDKADSVTVPLANGTSAFTPRGGCVSAARRELYGDLDRWFELSIRATNLQIETGPVVSQDARYTTALTAWRDCMAAAGHPVPSPGESRRQVAETIRNAPDPEAAWRLEVGVATADANCAGSARLVSVAEQADSEARAKIRAASPAEFAEYDAMQARAVQRAGELVKASTRGSRVD